jgi:hypothetical protein
MFSKNCSQPYHRPEKFKEYKFWSGAKLSAFQGPHMPWASPEQHEGIKSVSHDTKEVEVENCVVMATYLTF